MILFISHSYPSVTLIHPEETFTIPIVQTINKCSLFQNNSTLLVSPYPVQSPVSLSIFREFISALEVKSVKITDTHFKDLELFRDEFDFSEISAKLAQFRSPSDDPQRRQFGNRFAGV
jgi:hypothetical protein